ncbi:MAG: hypothetical protein Q4P29_06835 [Tissierellia bacterium]|nr:hypothetical protein [Tissierellia bacterium]
MEFDELLRSCYRKETAYPRCQLDWIEGDYAFWQCAVVAMIFNNYYGEIFKRIEFLAAEFNILIA